MYLPLTFHYQDPHGCMQLQGHLGNVLYTIEEGVNELMWTGGLSFRFS